MKGKTFLCDTGKGLGGTSARSFLWQIRLVRNPDNGVIVVLEHRLTPQSGTLGAFDKWADQVGDMSYTYKNMLPFFQRSAKFNEPDNSKRPANATANFNNSDWSSSGGPMQVGYPAWVNPISAWLGRSFDELGLKKLPSLMSGTLLGWSWLALNLDPNTQTRSSSEAFLKKALEETPNLIVYKSTLAKTIFFENGIAKGVTVESGGLAYNLTSNKEVILSAGVVSVAVFLTGSS